MDPTRRCSSSRGRRRRRSMNSTATRSNGWREIRDAAAPENGADIGPNHSDLDRQRTAERISDGGERIYLERHFEFSIGRVDRRVRLAPHAEPQLHVAFLRIGLDMVDRASQAVE